MRPRLLACAGVLALLALTGCTDNEAKAAAPMPPVRVVEQPAASAGGACILWDYAFIQRKIGVRFTVAGADQVENTSTCVVQTENGDYPNLALSVVESTDADADLFLKAVKPAAASRVKGLGKAGYRLVGKAGGDHGPTVEYGWLSEAEQLQTLKYTFAPGADAAAVTDMQGKLLSLAKAMDTTDG